MRTDSPNNAMYATQMKKISPTMKKNVAIAKPDKGEFSMRLRKVLSDAGVEEWGQQSELARIMSVSQRAAGKWLNAESIPRWERLVQLSRYFHVRAEWLLSGQGPTHEHGAMPMFEGSDKVKVVRVPVLTWKRARLITQETIMESQSIAEYIYVPTQNDAHDSAPIFALVVQNDVMESTQGGDTYREGATIIVDASLKAVSGDHVIVARPGVDTAIFRELRIEAGQRHLMALNTRYPTIAMQNGDRIVGVVIGTWTPRQRRIVDSA